MYIYITFTYVENGWSAAYGFYFEINISDKAEVCGLVPRGLDVPLALMAAGLAEGRTEEGERGGGEPERQRERRPRRYRAPTHRQTNNNHADNSSSEARKPTQRRTAGRVERYGCFCLSASAVNGSWRVRQRAEHTQYTEYCVQAGVVRTVCICM